MAFPPGNPALVVLRLPTNLGSSCSFKVRATIVSSLSLVRMRLSLSMTTSSEPPPTPNADARDCLNSAAEPGWIWISPFAVYTFPLWKPYAAASNPIPTAMPAKSTRLFRMISHKSVRTKSSFAGVKETFVARAGCCNLTSQCSTQSVDFAIGRFGMKDRPRQPTRSKLANHRVPQAKPRMTESRHMPDDVQQSTFAPLWHIP